MPGRRRDWIAKFKTMVESSDPQATLLTLIVRAKEDGLDQNEMIALLTELRSEVSPTHEDTVLDALDVVVGFCTPSKRMYPSQ